MSVGSRAEKFDIVSNDQGRTLKGNFSDLGNTLFGQIWSKKMIIVSSA